YEPLPKYTEVREGPVANPKLAQRYPLVFNSGARPQTDFRSQHHGIDGLVKDHPEPVVEINPKDATSREIKTGDLVLVSTLRGAVPFRARVTPDIVAGSIECNQGGGGPVGPQAWQEWNVNELTDMGNFDEISGFPVYKALLCEIKKIEEGTEETKQSAREHGEIQEPGFPVKNAVKSEEREQVYLDNNATTRVADSVRESMLPFLDEVLGNPASIHQAGRKSMNAVEDARRKVAKLIRARPKRIVFTGSGSESDNLAIKGVAFAYREKGDHIITTSIEHPAALRSCKFLEQMGFQVTYLAVDKYGFVKSDQLKQAIRNNTILVSIMLANNIVGTILPIKELCAVAHERGILFHTDAVQAVGKMEIDVDEMGVDLLSLSGHKFHGPKGVGALYIKKGVKLEPTIHGGKQENGFRAGTLNVPAIVGLGKAAELVFHTLPEFEKTRQLRDKLEKGIRKLIAGARLNGHPELRLPNTLNLTLPGLRGESLVIAMDQHGIAMSPGSACKSGSPEPTHVLLAMGRSEEDAHCSVRMSLSHDTTEQDIQMTLEALALVLDEMETTIRFLPCK
ncbi:MAG: IscS subfamily cysteine desulfurase, partial [Candidatus Aminicenantes bacterium]|nr:IscS subfamily cysteine desulfurase [Candidatus Aminicenantes bacterium]